MVGKTGICASCDLFFWDLEIQKAERKGNQVSFGRISLTCLQLTRFLPPAFYVKLGNRIVHSLNFKNNISPTWLLGFYSRFSAIWPTWAGVIEDLAAVELDCFEKLVFWWEFEQVVNLLKVVGGCSVNNLKTLTAGYCHREIFLVK